MSKSDAPKTIYIHEVLNSRRKPYKRRRWASWGGQIRDVIVYEDRQCAEEECRPTDRVVEFREVKP